MEDGVKNLDVHQGRVTNRKLGRKARRTNACMHAYRGFNKDAEYCVDCFQPLMYIQYLTYKLEAYFERKTGTGTQPQSLPTAGKSHANFSASNRGNAFGQPQRETSKSKPVDTAMRSVAKLHTYCNKCNLFALSSISLSERVKFQTIPRSNPVQQ